ARRGSDGPQQRHAVQGEERNGERRAAAPHQRRDETDDEPACFEPRWTRERIGDLPIIFAEEHFKRERCAEDDPYPAQSLAARVIRDDNADDHAEEYPWPHALDDIDVDGASRTKCRERSEDRRP